MTKLDADLLKILACPACKTGLSYNEGAGRLECTKCRKGYPVQDGIPVLLVEEARPL